MEKKLTTKQYADLMGVHDGYIRKMIHDGKQFPAGVKRESFGKAHVFIVTQQFVSQQKKRLKKVA